MELMVMLREAKCNFIEPKLRNNLLSNSRSFATRLPLKMTNSFIQALKIAILPFIVIFVSLITFCSKVRIRSRLKVKIRPPLFCDNPYGIAFNSILPFLVNFGILSPNHVISVNQGFRRFSQYLYVLQLSKINYTIINKHRFFVKFFLWWISVYPLVDSGKPLVNLRFTTRS